MMLDQYTESTNRLKELYEDKDGCRKEEIASLSGPNEFTEFYARLKSIKEFHRKHPNEVGIITQINNKKKYITDYACVVES